MRNPIVAALLVCGCFVAAAPSSAVMLDFSAYQVGAVSGSIVTPDVTFTSSTGLLYVGAAGGDHALCPLSGATCAATLTLTFAKPVFNLIFRADGDNNAASSVFVSGTAAEGAFSTTASGFDGLVHTFTTIDLSSIAGITSISLANDDRAGLGYDFFSFDTSTGGGTGAGAVPEPATWAMMLSGLGLVGFAMRRRLRAAAA